MGAGRSEMLMSIFGAQVERRGGEFFVEGKRVAINSPSDAIRHGIGFVTEDRKRTGSCSIRLYLTTSRSQA